MLTTGVLVVAVLYVFGIAMRQATAGSTGGDLYFGNVWKSMRLGPKRREKKRKEDSTRLDSTQVLSLHLRHAVGLAFCGHREHQRLWRRISDADSASWFGPEQQSSQ